VKQVEPTRAIASDYPAAFRSAVETVLANEGGFSDESSDTGGATKFGISQRQYPTLDIQGLTREAAVAIYYRDWWNRFNYGALAPAIGAKLFDLAVNMGEEAAVRAEAAGHYRLVAQTRYREPSGVAGKFLKGWLRRAYQ